MTMQMQHDMRRFAQHSNTGAVEFEYTVESLPVTENKICCCPGQLTPKHMNPRELKCENGRGAEWAEPSHIV